MALHPFSRYRHLLWTMALVVVAGGTLLLAACGSTSSTNAGVSVPTATISSDSATFQVDIVGVSGSYYFSPATLTIPKGAAVIWTNMSNAPHPVNSDTNAFSSPGNLLQSDTFQMVFTSAGTYPYHCGLHPYMKGTITVTA
jgi:plastocyanin